MNQSLLRWLVVCAVMLALGMAIGRWQVDLPAKSYDDDHQWLLESGQSHEDDEDENGDDENESHSNTNKSLSQAQSVVLIEQLKQQLSSYKQQLSQQTEQIARLQRKNAFLDEQLAAAEQQLMHTDKGQTTEPYPSDDNYYDSGRDDSGRGDGENTTHNLEEPYLSEQQLSELLPVEFHRFYSAEHRSLVKKYNQYLQQEREDQWAYLMEQRISDFIASHEMAGQLMVDVRCRYSSCQVHGSHANDLEIWRQISSQFRDQPWWNFTSVSSASSSDGERMLFLDIFHDSRRQ